MTMSNNTFEKWEDVLPYIGKEIGVRVVESPDIKGTFTGLYFLTDEKTGEMKKVFIRLNEWPGRFEFWECYPVHKMVESNPRPNKPDLPLKLVAAGIVIFYIIVGIAYLYSR